MKIGIDIHGVVDTISAFKIMAGLCVSAGHEVHIITGSPTDKAIDDLNKSGYIKGIHWTHLFSIMDYHKIHNTSEITYDDNGNGWMSDDLWNPTKADYCKRMSIDIHFDDSNRYGNYFITPYAQIR